MENKIPSGSEIIDSLLEGGYEKDIITTIYGAAGSGKTCLCLLAAIAAIKNGKKVVFIDTEGGFSVERLKQLDNDYKEIIEKIIFLKPTTFEEQKNVFEKLKETINDKIGLIILDSVGMLYRLELGKTEDVYDVNRELGQQLGILTEIARKKGIPVMVTNQVYADFDNRDQVKLVGGDIIKYGSKCLIELKKAHGNKRAALLVKHRSIPMNEVLFEIINDGIKEFKKD